jgi:hypothetical protein
MIVPRIGAILLLIAYGFAFASVARLMYVTASEGYGSWAGVAILIAPTAILGLASALLVLSRKPLGVRLAFPFCALLFVTAIITLLGAPPVGEFLDDYERAALARGVDVPEFLEQQGTTPQEYVDNEAGEVRSQGAIGAIVMIVVYAGTVIRGSRPRSKPAGPAKQAKAGA